MSQQLHLRSSEIGQLRVFLAPRERRNVGYFGLFSKPLCQEIIRAAKQYQLLNAVARRTHFGYSGQGRIEADNKEVPNDSLTVCIELIAARDDLEAFCDKYRDMLASKFVVYEQLERWEIAEVSAENDTAKNEQRRAA